MKIKRPIKRHVIFLALCSAGCWALSHPTACLAATANVTIVDFAFNPSTTTINANDQVKWTWDSSDSAPHSTTSNTGLWDSSPQSAGATFTHTFSSAGSFPYHCTVHTFMTATVTVNAVAVPPTITITNPANGAILTAPASFTLAATAAQSGGTVTNVQFLQGTTSLGNKTAIPFSIAISSLASGSYTFSAVASGSSGLKATNSITLTVNAPPTATLTSPTNGATFLAPWTGVLQASVGDSDGTVSKAQFFAGTNLLGTVSSPSANPSVNVTNLAAGSYVLTVVATDNHGATNTSAGVNISIVAPSGIILSLPSRVSDLAFQFSFTANPGLSYVILRSQGISGFLPISTNEAAGSMVNFLDSNATGDMNLYRVQLLSNP